MGLGTTERLHSQFSLFCIGEGNGNPLQYSCLEKHRRRGASWAAIYGVAQSWTRLKRLSSDLAATYQQQESTAHSIISLHSSFPFPISSISSPSLFKLIQYGPLSIRTGWDVLQYKKPSNQSLKTNIYMGLRPSLICFESAHRDNLNLKLYIYIFYTRYIENNYNMPRRTL